ncbi:MAG: hypothetical protein ABSA76_04085 [Bacteroidales bacterium]
MTAALIMQLINPGLQPNPHLPDTNQGGTGKWHGGNRIASPVQVGSQ